MSRQPSSPIKFAPLQRIVAEPITDPAEQKAMDEARMRIKQRSTGKQLKNRKPK
jgi:hypothetical protein